MKNKKYKEKYSSKAGKKPVKNKKIVNYNWIIKITVITFFISLFFSLLSETIIPNVNIFISLVLIMVLIPVIFYSYKAVTKKAILPIDIMTFYLVIVIAQLAFYKILELPNFSYMIEYLSVVGLFIVFGMYMTLTLAPLKNIIFEDPISGKYGIEGHTEFEHVHNKK